MSVSSITIQRGHAGRTTGSTGTIGEQAFTETLGPMIASRLRARGWTVSVVDADPPGRRYPDTDLFLALHADGNTNPTVGKASAHYPRRSNAFGVAAMWAAAWRTAHSARGYDFGFRGDNYVGDRVGERFYAWRQDRVDAGQATPAPICLLAEHYFATNPTERAWADANRTAMADAHVDAIGAVFNHPTVPAPPVPTQEPPTMSKFDNQFARAIELGLTDGTDRNGTAERDEAAVMVVRGIEYLEAALENERSSRRSELEAMQTELGGLREAIEAVDTRARSLSSNFDSLSDVVDLQAEGLANETRLRLATDDELSKQIGSVSEAVDALEADVTGNGSETNPEPPTGSQDDADGPVRVVLTIDSQPLATTLAALGDVGELTVRLSTS
jgi:archaellum component FlaC